VTVRNIFLVPLLILGLALGSSVARSQIAGGPPVAAPTSKIEVSPIPVVLSGSQEADNFASGLIQGAMLHGRVRGAGFVVVKEDHVTLQRVFGTLTPDMRLPMGTIEDVFTTVAAMQLVERSRLLLDEDVSKPLGETSPRGVTLAQLLTHQTYAPLLLAQTVEKAARQPLANYLAAQIVRPLGMAATIAVGGMETNLAGMGRFLGVLNTGGVYEKGAILGPATVDLMDRTHFTLHQALPGAAYGFAEMRRAGWRALERDGVAGDFDLRLVLVPEAKIGYFIAVDGHAGAEFWRTLDNGLFDKLLAPRGSTTFDLRGTPAPTFAEASAAAGYYEGAEMAASDLAALKIEGSRLNVSARADGALMLSGAENGVLAPRPGGYWATENGNLTAVRRGDRLLLSTGGYQPLALYKRPLLYAAFALATLLVGIGAFMHRRRKIPNERLPNNLVLGFGSATAAFLLASVLVWLLSPTA
jgi:hypothetical protein